MKTPNWATVIGIMMIVFGGCGAMNDIKSIGMPAEIAAHKERAKKEIEEGKNEDADADEDEDDAEDANAGGNENEVEVDSTDTATVADSTATSNNEEVDIPFFGKLTPEKIVEMSEFTTTWIVRFGYIGAVVSVIYLLGGIFLLVRKTFSIKLVYAALILSLLCSGIQTALLTSNASGDFLGVTLGLSQIPGLLIDIILLAVVFASEKDAYKAENLPR